MFPDAMHFKTLFKKCTKARMGVLNVAEDTLTAHRSMAYVAHEMSFLEGGRSEMDALITGSTIAKVD